MRVCGIDPGKSGAIALIDTDDWSIRVVDMATEAGKANREAVSPTGVVRIIDRMAPDHSFIEEVTSSPQMGVSSAFSFGRSLGIVLGATASRSVLTMVRPQVWKATTHCPKDKNQARRRAQEIFPCLFDDFKRVRDDGRAEACLLAFYGLLTLRVSPPRPLVKVTIDV